jgi:hypothetical protein
LNFYTLCNDHNRLLSLIHFTIFYKHCKQGVHDHTCRCTYYDMLLKRLRTIHSPQPPSSSSSAAADVHIPLGIDATSHGRHIRDRIALLLA